MFKKILWLMVLTAVPALAQNAAVQGHSFLGGVPAVTSGLKSSNYLNGIIPHATISVYYTGTPTLVPGNLIFSNATGTILGNPFTSNDASSVNPGGWLFFAAVNQGYDIVASGGITPNTYPVPVTLCTDCFPSSQYVSPGVTQIIAGTNITISPPGGTGAVTVNSSGGGGCVSSDCVLTDPTATQTVTQPSGTTLQANILSQQYWANLFGTGSNGIETVYGSASDCIVQIPNFPWGCNIQVSPLYTNSDAPQGWHWGGANFGNNISGLQMPSGSSVYDYRNGTLDWFFRDPINPVTGQGSGPLFRTDATLNQVQRQILNGGFGSTSGAMISLNEYDGGFDMNGIPFVPTNAIQDSRYGINLTQDNWTAGIDFGILQIMNHHGLGDALLEWKRLLCDGGILAANSEGCQIADDEVGEDPIVMAGTISTTSPTTGQSPINVNVTQGPGTQASNRLLLDTAAGRTITGTLLTSQTGPESTGTIAESAIMPPFVVDSTKNFAVSTIIQGCYAGTDNGQGGAAGCTAGSQPSGYIPAQGSTYTISAWSISGNVVTFTTSAQKLTAGQVTELYGFGASTFFDGQKVTVSAAGLTSTSFQAPFTHGTGSATEAGAGTAGTNNFTPPSTIVLNIVASYTGTGGDTNGQPAGFCPSSSTQVGTPGVSCGIPASGVAYVTDGIEYESDNYTYNQTNQTITITNMQFPHLNGMMIAFGGMTGYAIQDTANTVPSGLGTTGTIAPTYAVAGSLNATTLYYVPQRTNEQYGDPLLGLSNPSNGNPGYGAQLYFSSSVSGISITGGVVTFTMATPPQVNGDLHIYNGLTATLALNGDASYNGSYVITWVRDNVFTYTPISPTGTSPTSGTVTYSNAAYTLYPAARILSVYNPATNLVNGYFSLMPYNFAFANGDSVRVPHYQQMHILGRHDTISHLSPDQYLGGVSESVTHSGLFQGLEPGWALVNTAAATYYLGQGGTHHIPATGVDISGFWDTSFAVSAPNTTLISILGSKGIFGLSSKNSNINLVTFPVLTTQNPVPGVNGQDVLNYDPAYMLSGRSNGTKSGLFKCSNNPTTSTQESHGPSVCTMGAGYLAADYQVTSPTVAATNLETTQLTAILNFPNPTCTGTCTTTWNYFIVGNGTAGGQTFPITTATITNGCATLSSSCFNLICMPYQAGFASYDVLKTSTSTLLANVSALTPNGAGFGQPGDYSCVKDIGGSTSAYTPPTANTTGAALLQGALTIGGGTAINVSHFYATASITPTAVTAATCSDQTFTVTGMTTTDNLGSITPPGALGNVSVTGYPSAANTLTLHFCNPSAADVTPPAGVYSFLAMH